MISGIIDFETEKEKEDICEGCEESEELTETEIESQIDSLLQEVGASTIKMSKLRKIKAFAGLASLQTAKKINDPLYKKYKKLRDMAMSAKRALMKKYKSKGMRTAKKAMR